MEHSSGKDSTKTFDFEGSTKKIRSMFSKFKDAEQSIELKNVNEIDKRLEPRLIKNQEEKIAIIGKLQPKKV